MRTILFVCVQNSGRSQMAEAFFNKLSQGKARALSAGTSPSKDVDPNVVRAMREVGIDISGQKPRALTVQMLEGADKVISMGCGVDKLCPATIVETEDWALEDPKGKPLAEVGRIRDEIRRRVEQLLLTAR